MARKVRISIGLTANQHSELEAIAEETRLSVSWLGERAVIEFLDRHRNGSVQLPLALGEGNRR